MVRIELESEDMPTVEVTFDTGRYAGRTFKSTLRPCLDITCECGNIYLEFEPENGEGFFECTFNTLDEDVIAYELSEEEEADREEKDFVEQLSDEVTEENWQQLSTFYLAIKAAATEVIEPEEITTRFDVNQAEQGIMFSYHEVLPYAIPFTFECEGAPFEVEDLYCLKSGCGCTVINLNFWKLNEAADWEEDKPDLWVDYDYRHGKAEVLERKKDSLFTADQLLDALGQQLPEFKEIVKHRHERFRAIYRSFLKQSGINPNKAWAARSLEAPPKLAGRNDPCPCGSGKKIQEMLRSLIRSPASHGLSDKVITASSQQKTSKV